MIRIYPGALWMPADRTNYRRAGRAGFEGLVIHATDGHGDPRKTAAMWQSPIFDAHGNPKPSSAHLVIGLDETVIQCVAFDDIAFHAHGANDTTIGMEHCCRSPGELGVGDPGLKPTPGQLRKSAEVALWLCEQGGFEPSRRTIRGHKEADPKTTHDDCPEGAGIILDAYVGTVFALKALGA